MILTNIYEKDIAEAPYTDKDNSKSSRSSASATKNIIPQSAQKSNTSEENNLKVRKSKDDTIYLSTVERGDMETVQKRRINGFAWS